MKAAIYIRVSGKRQVDGFSLAAQERACRDYANARGWRVVEVYAEEGRTGRNDQRPQFQQLLADAHRKPRPFNVVIFHNLDRLFRNLRLQLNLKVELDKATVQ